MAQTACWAVLSLHRHAFDYADQQRLGDWRPLAQRRADEVAVLVLGLGEMGAASARALAGLGYPVTGWSARPRDIAGVTSRSGWDSLPDALAAADIVVNLLPLTPDTRHLFDRTRLARMRRGACLVNLARGGHVVEADLIAALDSGHIDRAMLDVFETEPLPADHPLWSHPRVTVWPHAAAWTDLRTAVAVVRDNVEALRRGAPLRHLVDSRRGY
jgi:glyoxylate/hydroxypyruvate reductase A